MTGLRQRSGDVCDSLKLPLNSQLVREDMFAVRSKVCFWLVALQILQFLVNPQISGKSECSVSDIEIPGEDWVDVNPVLDETGSSLG